MTNCQTLFCIGCIVLVLLSPTILPITESCRVVVDGDGVIFGGTCSSKWVDSDTIKTKIQGGEQYDLYNATTYIGQAVGSSVKEEGGSGPFINLKLPSGVKSSDVTIALSGLENALPRIPKELDVKRKVYIDIVQGVLKQKGLPNAKANINRLWRIDLDGDGIDEVLIEAMTSRKDFQKESPYKSGDYSMVLLRKLLKVK